MRRLAALTFLALGLSLAAVAHEGHDGGIDIVDVSGPLDALAMEFIIDSIEEAAAEDQELVLLQINSRAVLDAEAFARLHDLLGAPPVPVAAWVGPAPAAALGGAQVLVELVEHRAIAPGSVWGATNPIVLSRSGGESGPRDDIRDAEEWGIELHAAHRQYLQALDGRTFNTANGPVEVSTIRQFGGGVTLKEVTFRKPGLVTRFFRLAVLPEAAFFFLVAGLAIATFEFYALGPGVAAGVAGISLLLAGWGIVTLPVRWWALSLVIGGWMMLAAAHQRGRSLLLTAGGTLALQVGGMTLIDGRGQLDPRWWLILPTVVAVVAFFLVAMPTVQRARLSTTTVGREGMVGRTGMAMSKFDPDGLVEVGGARWRATSHRESGLEAGSQVVVTGVDGLYLEVDRVVTERET